MLWLAKLKAPGLGKPKPDASNPLQRKFVQFEYHFSSIAASAKACGAAQ